MALISQNSVHTANAWGPSELNSLTNGLDALGLHASAGQLAKLQTYARLLLKWNRTYNLVGATTPQVLIESHLLDSLAALPALDRWLPVGNPPLLDIGSGAGLPGIALAILRDHLPLMLVEPIGKKAAFLRQAIAQCGLRQVRVLKSKVEDLDLSQDLSPDLKPDGQPAPHFICRAFTSLERFAALCAPHVGQGSLLFAMKAARVGEELAQMHGSIEVLAVEPLHTTDRDVQRTLVVMRVEAPLATLDATRPGR